MSKTRHNKKTITTNSPLTKQSVCSCSKKQTVCAMAVLMVVSVIYSLDGREGSDIPWWYN